jgi:RNA polymerase sigma-70 factor (ECF subfamily)
MTTIDTDALRPITDAAPDPATAASSADESARATRLLRTLPPRQQEAIRLKFQHELSYAQIATVMETNVNNVAVLIHTALRTLREQMK